MNHLTPRARHLAEADNMEAAAQDLTAAAELLRGRADLRQSHGLQEAHDTAWTWAEILDDIATDRLRIARTQRELAR